MVFVAIQFECYSFNVIRCHKRINFPFGGYQIIMDILINNDANIEAKDKNGLTPLIIAAQKGTQSPNSKKFV